MTDRRTKCRRCGEPTAVVELRRHNAAFCRECFLHFFREQVKRAIERDKMLDIADRVLIAVSGGKDSLALWDVLIDMGYDTTGFHIVLWTGEEYAPGSLDHCRRFADERGAKIEVCDIKEETGFAIPDLPRVTGRPTCGACGLAKRHLIGKAASDLGYDVVAIGHNLDDEAAVLLGNVLRWDEDYLGRQSPVLDGERGFVKKVKPLHRLSERETAAYAFLRGIDYQVEECPLVAGNTQLRYKQALDLLESTSPGTKAAFYQGFMDKGRDRYRADAPDVDLHPCATCGQPTPAEVCAYCRMIETASKRTKR
jgi:tRNA-5-methyluridine54 2-sulfurtransferase